VHALLAEYLSFIVLLFALYTVAGGILVTGNIRATPVNITVMPTLGTSIACIVGTTGAAMILIRPLLRAIEARRHRVHVVFFFIILGGALSPLGDSPLFVGFLRGVDFFRTAQHLWLQTIIVAATVLPPFFVLDEVLGRMAPGFALITFFFL
jgi:Na+/H+ antiporter NhaD/arsenite permease-like protein